MSDIPIGIVYVMTNPAMPGLIKIGHSTHLNVEKRATELSANTGVPLPFEGDFSVPVEYPRQREADIHARLAHYRVSPDREFFRIEYLNALHVVADVLWSTYHRAADPRDPCLDLLQFMRSYLAHMRQMHDKYPSKIKYSSLVTVLEATVQKYAFEQAEAANSSYSPK